MPQTPPFLDFNLNLETFIDELKTITSTHDNTINRLLNIEAKNYQNFIKPFEMLEEDLSQFFTPLSHINAVKNSELTQKVYAEALPIITEYSTKISQNIAIYRVFQQIKQQEYAALNHEERRVIDLNILNFEL
ncbi:MAG: M3 family peptidase, partial [Sulfurimonas sp.]